MNVVAHFDEIFLKGGNQRFFVNQLKKNIEHLFPKSHTLRLESGIWIENIQEEDLSRLALIPGIANFSPAFKAELDFEKIVARVESENWGDDFKSFRITANRSDKTFPMDSVEIERELGSRVNIKFGWKVKLKNPDLEIHLNIGTKEVIVYGNLIKGAGGLPVGTAEKVMCLLSGGIDSPVAAYKMMVRGAEVELIHFQNQTHVTEEVSKKIMDLAKVLTKYHGPITLHIVPFEPWQKQIIMKVPSDYRMLLSRRLMFKISQNVAHKVGALAMATGDSLGQVASQTIQNLAAVYQSVDLLKLTPLIAENKTDIMNLARRLGTLEISERPYEDCCSLLVSNHPQTKSKIEDVLKIEEKIDLSQLDKTEIISYHIGM